MKNIERILYTPTTSHILSSQVEGGQFQMNKGESHGENISGSAKATTNVYGTQTKEDYSSPDILEDPSATKGELHFGRIDISQIKKGIKIAETSKANAELELSEARKSVKDLASRIEESKSRVTNIDKLDKKKRLKDGMGLSRMKIEESQYAEVTRELENIKQELSKLKFDVAYVLEEKKNAENETEASSSIFQSYSSLAEELRKKIDELNEEHVLVALARMEALKEYATIEAERKEEAKKYLIALDKARKKVNDLSEEAAYAEEVGKKLAVTTADVDGLNRELALIKEMDIWIQENSKHLEVGFKRKGKLDSMSFLHTLSEESEAARKELAAINEEGFQLMSSMDIIREELKQLAKETVRLRKTEEKAEITIQSVNSKLLRAKSKFESLSAAEEKANSMSSSLAGTLKHLRTEAEAAKKERELYLKETAKIKAEILRTKSEIYLDEAKLEASIQELRAVKSSEATALETLKTLVEISMKARATTSQHDSTITISTFEYEYLKGHAVEAKKVADKKVGAAQAWTEALRTSEKEIIMETMITQRKIREIGVVEEEAINFVRKRDKILEPEQVQFEVASSRKGLNRYSISTPARRPRFRRSGSPAGFNMSRSSITIDRRRKGVQNLSKFFSNENTKGKERTQSIPFVEH